MTPCWMPPPARSSAMPRHVVVTTKPRPRCVLCRGRAAAMKHSAAAARGSDVASMPVWPCGCRTGAPRFCVRCPTSRRLRRGLGDRGDTHPSLSSRRPPTPSPEESTRRSPPVPIMSSLFRVLLITELCCGGGPLNLTEYEEDDDNLVANPMDGCYLYLPVPVT